MSDKLKRVPTKSADESKKPLLPKRGRPPKKSEPQASLEFHVDFKTPEVPDAATEINKIFDAANDQLDHLQRKVNAQWSDILRKRKADRSWFFKKDEYGNWVEAFPGAAQEWDLFLRLQGRVKS